MKKILITGANSYIGTSFETYMKQWIDEYQIETVDMIGNEWRNKDFSDYDTVFHVAGIAHVKETKENRDIYYTVNRDLAIETAKKAKLYGVKQFIFLSSMSVYGMETGVITRDTIPTPKTNYGKSKLEAEQGLKELMGNDFTVSIIRPPMVYGKDCKGNFQTLVRIVRKFPVFPYVKNERSMIYICHLCAFIKLMINNKKHGVFFPQNKEYFQTVRVAKIIAETLGKKVYVSRILGFIVEFICLVYDKPKKAFKSLVYKNVEDFDYIYSDIPIDMTIRESV